MAKSKRFDLGAVILRLVIEGVGDPQHFGERPPVAIAAEALCESS
jgi:hypothetical protein